MLLLTVIVAVRVAVDGLSSAIMEIVAFLSMPSNLPLKTEAGITVSHDKSASLDTVQ